MNLERKVYSADVAGRELKLEVSRLAEQANAAVLATYGDTSVLATVVMGREDKDTDFMPLTVDYEEKYYAIGKILGSQYMRREGRASTEAILTGRIIDRAIRPLFDHRIRRAIQVTATILSYDGDNDPDFVAFMAVSSALAISDIPWNGPIAGLSLSKFGDELIMNPLVSVIKSRSAERRFGSFVAGLNGKINMIELDGYEASEEEIIASYEKAMPELDKIVAFISNIAKEIGKPKADVALKSAPAELVSSVSEYLSGKLEKAVYVKGKTERELALAALGKEMKAHLEEKGFDEKAMKFVDALYEEAIDAMVHEGVLKENRRPDGRAMDEVRELHAEAGLFKRIHGSALFVRGNTQSLAMVTLAAPGAEQVIENIEFIGKKNFMLHYNFPAYSVGETGSFRGPGRRDIGHGALAEKAVAAVMPSQEEFPCTVRVVSEILSSNGSSSMATVCSSCLALMDAGVPIKKPVAGIAMGLMESKDGSYKVLTDIQGPEDHYGDMDFKVAGTDSGVNAIQMDVKISGIALPVLAEGLKDAKKARLHILSTINSALSAPRAELSPFAPRVVMFDIDPDRIGAVIGSGGKVINGIIARTGVEINIEDSGRVFVASPDKNAVESAVEEIKAIVHEYKVGEIVEGTVIKTLDFGAIVDLGGGKDGMIHVSELREGFVKTVTEVVNVGDFVRAKVIRSEDGKIGLSIKRLEDKKPEEKKETAPAD